MCGKPRIKINFKSAARFQFCIKRLQMQNIFKLIVVYIRLQQIIAGFIRNKTLRH